MKEDQKRTFENRVNDYSRLKIIMVHMYNMLLDAPFTDDEAYGMVEGVRYMIKGVCDRLDHITETYDSMDIIPSSDALDDAELFVREFGK